MNAESADEIACRLAGPGRYKFDVLVEGIEAEQQRLVGGAFLALFWLSVYDFEGLTEWLVLGRACPDVSTATRYVEDELEAFRLVQLAVPTVAGGNWEINDDRRSVPGLKPAASIEIKETRTLTLGGGPYHRIDVCGHVIGPFPGAVVGRELFDMLQGRHEAWEWFVSAGESHQRGEPPARITKHIED